MASVLRSLSNAVVTTFDTVGDIGVAVQKTVGMATSYINRAATSADIVGTDSVILSTSVELRKIQVELDADPKLRQLFDVVALRFNKP